MRYAHCYLVDVRAFFFFGVFNFMLVSDTESIWNKKRRKIDLFVESFLILIIHVVDAP